MAYETRAVLSGAYAGKSPKLDHCLTHVVELDADGTETRVLCRRVRLENIADTYSATAAELAEPATCPTCARRDPRNPT